MNVRVCCVRAVAGVCARQVGLRHLQRTARYKPNKHKMPLSVSPAYFPTLDFYKQMRQEGFNCFNSPFTTSFDLNKYIRCCFQNIFLTSLRIALVSIFIYMTCAMICVLTIMSASCQLQLCVGRCYGNQVVPFLWASQPAR